MPDRSKEELEQIYNDLLEIKSISQELGDKLDGLWPNLMNDKTWQEEKNEYYDIGINAYSTLLRTNKVKSCEIRTFCEIRIQDTQNQKGKKGFWNHYGAYHVSPDKYEVGDILLDQLLSKIGKMIKSDLSPKESKDVNRILDEIGTSACEPRAFMENPGKDEDHSNKIIGINSKNVTCSRSI